MSDWAPSGCPNRNEKGYWMKDFPRDPKRHAIWAAQIKRDGWYPTNYSRLCEATEGDGKKRRSFLPAPKKVLSVPLTPSQLPLNDGQTKIQSSELPLVSDVFSPTTISISSLLPKPSSSGAVRSQLQRSYHSESTRQERQVEESGDRTRPDRHLEQPAFGKGLRVGARVKIGGVKPGVLRYLGTTHLAPGIFCGIELLDPDGNHDGEVNGHRYFTCSPNHGIFAPKEKVCLDISDDFETLALEFYYNNTQSQHGKTSRSYYSRELLAALCSSTYSAQQLPDVTSLQDFTESKYFSRAGQFNAGLDRSLQEQVSQDFNERKKHYAGLKSNPLTTSLQPKLTECSDYSSQSKFFSVSLLETECQVKDSAGDYELEQDHEGSPTYGSADSSQDDKLFRDTFSKSVKAQVGEDSKQYLNLTFDAEELRKLLHSKDDQSKNDFKDRNLSITHGSSDDSHSKMDSNSKTDQDRVSLCFGQSDSGHNDNMRHPLNNSIFSNLSSSCYTTDETRPNQGNIPDKNIGYSTLTISPEHTKQVFLTTSSSEDTETEEEEEEKLVQPSQGISCQKQLESSNDDDNGGTGDERVEADQVCAHNSDKHVDAITGQTVSVVDEVNDTDNSQKLQPVDGDIHSNHTSGSKQAVKINNDDLSQQSEGRTRKHITITKKRSENVDHKMPNINVTSRLADYIKAPVPVKLKEEKEQKKLTRNMKNVTTKRLSLTDVNNTKSMLDISNALSVDKDDKADDKRHRTRADKQEAPKPIIKRTPRKSKWDEIMSQIEANKDIAKPKPMSEIKSSLAAYLSTPATQLSPENSLDNPSSQRTRESKSKLKQLPPPPPKIDLSKVKSKLNVPTAASAIKSVPKREHSPTRLKSKSETRSFKDVTPTDSGRDNVTEDNVKVIDGSIILTVHPAVSEILPSDVAQCYSRDNQSGVKDGVTSKEESADLRKKENCHSLATEHLEKTRSTLDSHSKQTENKKGHPISNESKKHRVSTNFKVPTNKNSNPRIGRKLSLGAALKEIERLESLEETRARDFTNLKIQFTATTQAFDAVVVLLNYSCNELKAFECPKLAQEVEIVHKQLKDCFSQIAALGCEKETLEKNLFQIREENAEISQRVKESLDEAEREREDHARLTLDLNNTHTAEVSSQREELLAKYDETMKKLTQFYERQIELLRQDHGRQVANVTNEGKLEINSLKISHLEEVQDLRNKHDHQMEELHKQHRNKLEDMTQRFEFIKISLLEKVDLLRKECDDLARRARDSEEALQRDADVKVQIALSPYLSLPSEIESLKSVQEMRLEEIQKLRNKIMDLEKLLEEVPIAREKIISLQQKVENLEAIISIKTEHEKQLHEKCQVLMRKYDRESRANKRISMDFEQVMWRMSQSSDFGSSESLTKRQFSQSPARNVGESGDSESCTVTSTESHGDSNLPLRKLNGHGFCESDRKLKSRSASFLTGKNENTDCHSLSLSPQIKQKRIVQKQSQVSTADNGTLERMCQSAGPEVMCDPSDVTSQQDLWRKSSEMTELKNLMVSEVTYPDMTHSYARSLSGVSDSGVYDSIVQSDILNSSTVSTDSEWGTSVHLSAICDTRGGEYESGPVTGDYLPYPE